MSKATLLSRVVSRKTVALIIRFDFFFALVNINSCYGYLPSGLSLATVSEYIRLLSLVFALIMSNCRKRSWTNFQRNKKEKMKDESNKLFKDSNFYQFMLGKKWKEPKLLSFYPIFLKIHFTPIYFRWIENSLIVCTDMEVKKFDRYVYVKRDIKCLKIRRCVLNVKQKSRRCNGSDKRKRQLCADCINRS